MWGRGVTCQHSTLGRHNRTSGLRAALRFCQKTLIFGKKKKPSHAVFCSFHPSSQLAYSFLEKSLFGNNGKECKEGKLLIVPKKNVKANLIEALHLKTTGSSNLGPNTSNIAQHNPALLGRRSFP